jgi:hypothetical protein
VQRSRAIGVDPQIVAIETIVLPGTTTTERSTLDHIHVEIAVVVVVEERHSWRHDLGQR